MNLLVLHLSDIHVHSNQDEVLKRGEAIGRATFKDLSLADAVAVLITGDIAYSGKRDQYEAAKVFIDGIVATIRRERDLPINVLMCPGNHDCDFDGSDQDVRDIVIDRIRKMPPDEIKESLVATCTSVQDNYFDLQNHFKTGDAGAGDRLWETFKIPVGHHVVAVHCLNVAWMSKRQELPGSIVFPTKRYETSAKASAETTIVCMHHPLNWFAQPSYRAFRQLVRQAAHLILTGHEHTQSAAFIDDTDSGESVAIDGGVLQDSGSSNSRFNIILVDLSKQEYSVSFHEWGEGRYVPLELEAAWSSFKRLPEKKNSEFALIPEFLSWLTNAGAQFNHHGKDSELVLDDIYVFPELRPLGDDELGRVVVDAANLRNPTSLKRGVLVKGREQHGKTSLLKQLFKSYRDRGYVPVFLSGGDLTKHTPLEVQKTVDSAIGKIYGKPNLSKFWQVGVDRRVLLLDDIDDTPLTGNFLSRTLEYLSENFSLMVVTSSELFELRELIAAKGEHVLQKLDHFDLLEFGHRRRFDLIKRWISLGDASYSIGQMVGLIDQSEKLITNVIGEGVVPSTPFFLLILLQSAESASTSNLQQSALGDYYRYLIIHSLEVKKVAREEHNEILNYCAHLSWFLYQTTDKSVSQGELEKFHQAFVQRHGLSIRFDDRKVLLLNAHLIEAHDGEFRFHYPYLYYYFLGKYLAEHLHDDEVQEVVRKCCQHLHRQDNGNIILFLGHHSRDPRVYESVLAVLQQHFSEQPPMTLDGDVDVVNRLVESAPQLIFDEGDVIQNRGEIRKHQDESSESQKVLTEDLDSLPQEVINIMSLFKTIDILGQFLKNHYGQLEADIKEKLLKELFDGGLRGMRNFFELLLYDTDGLIHSIESVLEKRGLEDNPIKRNERAKREMFGLVGLFAFGFIRRCGVAVASPHLTRVIENVVDKNPTTAFRLISGIVELEKQGGLDDIANLRKLNQAIKGNSVAQAVLQHMVLGHMHLYATTVSQKQKICAELNIRVQDQFAIDYKTRGSKRL